MVVIIVAVVLVADVAFILGIVYDVVIVAVICCISSVCSVSVAQLCGHIVLLSVSDCLVVILGAQGRVMLTC